VRLHAIVHKALPLHGAGAEAYLHAVLKWLAARGHSCSAAVAHAEGSWTLDGVSYIGALRPELEPIEKADVLLTHLDVTRIAIWHARRIRKPLVHLIHNHNQLRYHRVSPDSAQLVVFNSQWLQRVVRWDGPSIVLHPPVFARDYQVVRGKHDAVVLCNLSEPKGGEIFWQLAHALPHRRFIGVLGAYGEQVVPADIPHNAEVWENRSDPRDFYREARVILMPSSYESFGRVAIEAAASGIPTIAHATDGLLEALGPAAVYADRHSLQDWLWALEMLDHAPRYEEAQQAALRRSRMWDPQESLLELETALEHAATVGVARPRRGNPYSV
jgi:glycosyltransferase involved in cell wall biosynthesis